MLSREERILTELLVSRGIVSEERIARCAQGRSERVSPPSLVDALVDSGEVERHEAQEAAAEAHSLAEALAPELPAGHMLGEFRLVREIGRGGMGIVYEAEQVALGRRVALKILPAGAALDERLSVRFLREARAVGRLQHPGIVPVYTSGQAGGVLYYAMELIEGRSLADRLAAGPLPPEEAARIAAEVARALDYAHGLGLVHRDVKPENILLCASGRARIVDFGLVHDLAAGPFTLSRHVLGTPAFTAPEQARGEPVGPQADIYAVGAVLYAMLAGAPPYAGVTASAVFARLLTEEPPPLSRSGRNVPRALAAIVSRAMAREPAARYETAGALAEALERFAEAADGRAAPARSFRRLAWGAGACAAVVLVTIALVLRSAARRPPLPVGPAPQLQGAAFRVVPSGPGHKAMPALSPDGTQLAYASNVDGDWDVYLLELTGDHPPVNLTADSPFEDFEPAFSRDGRAIAFASTRPDRSILVMDLASRTLRLVVRSAASHLAWSADGRSILYTDQPYNRPGNSATTSKLWAADVATGHARMLTGMYAVQPAASAAAGRIAFVSQRGGRTELWTIPETGGAAVRLTTDEAVEWSPVWTPDGKEILFGSDRTGTAGLWKIAVDPATGGPAGEPTQISAAAFATPFYLTAGATGSPLVLSSVGQPASLHRLTVDADHVSLTRVPDLAGRFLAVECAELSPDGERLVFAATGGDEDLAISGADGSGPRLLTRDAFRDRAPRWSPDGALIAFQSDRGGAMEIWTIRPDGSGLARRTQTAGEAGFPVWSPDGQHIAFARSGRGAGILSVAAEVPEELPAAGGMESFVPSSWSPDGESLAGSAEGVVVYSIPDRRFRRLTDAGERPVWLADGRHLLYAERDEIRILDSRTGAAHVVFSAVPGTLLPCLSASADGRTIYASLSASTDELWLVDLRD